MNSLIVFISLLSVLASYFVGIVKVDETKVYFRNDLSHLFYSILMQKIFKV